MNIVGVSTCTDDEFKQYIKSYKQQLFQIKIPEDTNGSIGRVILSQLDEVYAYIRVDLAELEGAHHRAESIIRENERLKAEGRNEEERKKNASAFLESYPVGDEGDTVNMYEYERLLSSRYTMVRAFVDVISNKQQRLITMSGFLKVDGALGNNY